MIDRRWIQRRSLQTAAFCAAIAVGVFALVQQVQRLGGFERADLALYDHLLKRLPPESRLSGNLQTDRFVVVTVGDDDIDWLREIGEEIPLRDHVLADAIERLRAMGPRAIAVDLIRDQWKPPLRPAPGRKSLRTLVDEGVLPPMVFMAAQLSPDERAGRPAAPPLPSLVELPWEERSPQLGAIDLAVDRDGVIRRGLIVTPHPTERLPNGNPAPYLSLAALAAVSSAAVDFAELALHAQFGSDACAAAVPVLRPARAALRPLLVEQRTVAMVQTLLDAHPEFTRIPTASVERRLPVVERYAGGYVGLRRLGNDFLLDFRAPRHGDDRPVFATFPLRRLLEGGLPRAAVADRVVFVGQTAESVADHAPTPLSLQHPGVYIHAHTAEQLLRAMRSPAHVPIGYLGNDREMLWTFGWVALGGLLGILLRGALRFGLVVTAGAAGVYFCSHRLLLHHHVWLPAVAPVVGFAVCATLVVAYMAMRERAMRWLTRQVFESHVDSGVVRAILRDPDAMQLSRKVHVAVLYTDLAGFGQQAERMPAEALFAWLNSYMEPMSHVVLDNHGMINKYIGDAIMAVFGVPLTSPGGPREDAANAVECALDMRAELERLNAAWSVEGRPTARMRVGIMCGEVVAGLLGSERRLEYTVIGVPVNQAARLEACAKELMGEDICIDGCRIFVGEPVYRLIADLFHFEEMPPVEFKAGEAPVRVFSVIGRKADESDDDDTEDGIAGHIDRSSTVEPLARPADRPRQAARAERPEPMDEDDLGLATDAGRSGGAP